MEEFSWKRRKFVAVLGFILIVASLQVLLRTEVEVEVVAQNRVQEFIDKYLEAKKSGLSHEDIAATIFKVKFPNEDPKFPHSYPFVTGDTFRAFADFVYEIKTHNRILYTYQSWERTPAKKKLNDGDVIFVHGDIIERFAKEVFPHLNKRVILITHNSDWNRPEEPYSLAMLYSDNLIMWFVENAAVVDHPKLTPIPIGIQNRRYNESGFDVIQDLDKYIGQYKSPFSPDAKDERENLVYINFSPRNMSFRENAIKVFKPFSLTEERSLSMEDYWARLKNSKFVLSPPGIGEDCFRTYEAILLGAIPIVRESTLKNLFDKSPVYVLDDWNSVSQEQFLNFRLKTTDREVILAQYWFDLINSYRQKYL